MENIHLGIIEDDPVIRESLETYLGAHPALQFSIVAGSVEEFLEKADKPLHRPKMDVLLLDIGLPGMSGIEGIRHIRQKFPDTDIVMLTTFEENDKIFKSLCSGACSYIAKRTPLSTIQEAIFTIHRGGSFMSPSIARKVVQHFMPKVRQEDDLLSPRQQQIVEGLVDGLSYKLIADKLSISIDTVRDHIKRIYRALEVNSKAEIIRKALDGDI
ncbi:MAG: response regulator transcription factor [Saprospiraceae bacterium]|nr:response regulator transcription factor [Saprospiraceae bacterium]